MKKYDFKSVEKYIQKHSDYISEVTLGMKEDWYWTATTIYENDRFEIELSKKDLTVGGISSSSWATPTMMIVFKDGREIWKDCYTGESDKQRPEWLQFGCLSGPCQDEINKSFIPKLER